MTETPAKQQNKAKILLAEAFSGMVTALLVSPTNVVVDKSVIQYANKA